MALIHCPECNKEISDKAKTCPHCGCPVEETNAKVPVEEKERSIIDPSNNMKNMLGSNMKICQKYLIQSM